MLVGYARTSTIEQLAGLDSQIVQLERQRVEKIFSEQISSVLARDALSAALDFVREGDALVITKLDRLARSTTDLLTIIAKLEAKGVGLRVLDFGGSEIDTKSPTGKMIVTMFGAVAEFERALMLERQRAGITRAKAEGKYRGRAPTALAKAAQASALRKAGVAPAEIASRLGISRASVYRIIGRVAA